MIPPLDRRELRLPDLDAIRAVIAEHDARAALLRRLLRLLLKLEDLKPGDSPIRLAAQTARGDM